MSKLSFRARALDATKAMPIYRKDEVSDLPDYSVLNRAVPQMPTGMEKEEESEHHLQRAISAQQVYGHKKVMVIPVPEAEVGVQYYNSIYKKSYRLPKQYIHNQAQALNSIMEQERPDYDMDSEDERWVRDINKRTGLDIKEIQFEEMIDRLEKSCGNQVVSLQEAKLLLKEDDDLIKAVYDYWLQKRLKMIGPLVVQVRQERRDGSSSGDSYVAFRRRTEKMQTRKNRKNDEASYEKMLKLRRDLSRAVTILEMIKRREKSKRELLHLTLEIAEKRYQMKDWDGKFFKSAKREVAGPKSIKLVSRSKHPSGNRLPVGINPALLMKGKVGKLEVDRENGITQKKKRYRKHKHNKLHNFPTNIDGGLNGGSGHRHGVSSFKMPKMHSASALSSKPISSTGTNKVSVSATNSYSHLASLGSGAMAPRSNVGAEMTYQQVVDTMHQYEFQSSDEERPKSPLSGSLAPEEEKKKNPDGTFAFRRKPGCKYNAPLDDLSGDHWPWMTDERHRYSLTTLAVPEKCMGFCRRRVGRGGRILFDRAYSPWNKQLSEIDLNPEAQHLPHKQDLQELLQEIKHGRWRRYRPYDPKIHKTHKLLRIDKQDKECDKQSFGHSNAAPVDGIPSKTSEPKGMSRTESNQVSSDSETVDIMTTDGEGSRGELLHKKLALQKTYYTKSLNSPSPLKHGMIHKRILESGLVPGGAALDKSTAMFAVSALVVSTASKVKTSYLTTDSKSHRSKVKSCRVQTPLKLNVVTAGTVSSSMMSTQTMLTTMAMQATNSPGKYIYSGVPIAETITPMSKQSKSKGKFTLDSAKLVEMKSRDKVSLMSVVGMNTSTPNLNTLTFPMSGSTQRVSLTTTQAGSSAGVVSFAVAQPSMTQANQKNWQQHSISVQDVLNSSVQSQRTPVTVMATLRISNPSSGSQSANIHGAIITNSNTDNPGTPVSSSYLTTASNENQSTIGTLFIAPSSRHHYPKGSIGDNNTTTIPFALSTLGPHVASQLKNSQRLISGHQSVSPSINLALTPTTPQKHTLSQLSIPHTSSNSPAVLIATPAGGSVASGLPSFRTTVMEAGTAAMVSGGSNGSNGSQTKTVSINVARLTLQQPNSEISSGTPSSVTSTIVSHSHGSHSAQTWVPSGSGPNILKLGPSGVGATGIQIHPVLPQRTLGVKQETTDRIFKMGGNKALTVISKRMRNPVVNATRTISIGNSKQQVTNINNNKTAASSHMTLLPDGRTALAKPYISIGHAAKNNAAATVVPDTKGMPVVEQSCLLTNSDKMPPQISEGQAGQVSVTDASSGLNKPSKNNQAMEVT